LIEGHRRPEVAAAVFAGCGIRPPRVGTGLTILGHDVETPHLFAVPDSKSSHPPLSGCLGACRSDVDQIAMNQGRQADEIAFLRSSGLFGAAPVAILRTARQEIPA